MIFFLFSGAPHHLELKSQAFDDSSQMHDHTAKFFSYCFLSAPIYAYVCDRSGNKTPLKTTLSLSWTPASCGAMLTKKTTQKGELMFDANTLKCGSRTGEQQVKLRVSSSEHRNLQVSCFRSVCYKYEFRFQPKRNYKKPTGNKQGLGKAQVRNFHKNGRTVGFYPQL